MFKYSFSSASFVISNNSNITGRVLDQAGAYRDADVCLSDSVGCAACRLPACVAAASTVWVAVVATAGVESYGPVSCFYMVCGRCASFLETCRGNRCDGEGVKILDFSARLFESGRFIPMAGALRCFSCDTFAGQCVACERWGSHEDLRTVGMSYRMGGWQRFGFVDSSTLVCGSCVLKCRNCGDVGSPLDASWVKRDGAGYSYCGGCVEDAVELCRRCDTYVETCEDSNYVDGVLTCRSCRRVHLPADWVKGDDIPAGWKSDLLLSQHDGEEEIRSYLFQPSTRFFGRSKYRRFLGVELEVSTSECDRGRAAASAMEAFALAGKPGVPMAYLKNDSSIGDGFEIVTHPHTWTSFKKRFPRSLLTDFAASGVRSWATDEDYQCGLHVHVSRAALSTASLYNILFLTANNADFFTDMAGRESDRWAAAGTDHAYELLELARGENHRDRYYMVNLATRKPTIEFRLGKGSLDPVRVFGWVGLIDAFVAYCVELAAVTYPSGDIPFDEDAIDLPSLVGFVNYLLDHASTYPDTITLADRVFAGGLNGYLAYKEAFAAFAVTIPADGFTSAAEEPADDNYVASTLLNIFNTFSGGDSL